MTPEEQAYFLEHHQQLGSIGRDVLSLIGGEETLPEDRRALAQRTLDALIARFGYERSSIKVALGEVLSKRHPR